MGEGLSGGDVIHEHHPLRLAKQLSCEAVVPAQRVCMRPPEPGDTPTRHCLTLGVDLMYLGSFGPPPVFCEIYNEALSSWVSALWMSLFLEYDARPACL